MVNFIHVIDLQSVGKNFILNKYANYGQDMCNSLNEFIATYFGC